MNALRILRLTGFLEGASFLALLFVAMPIKYLLGGPLAVRITGTVHGVLFLVFLVVLSRAASDRRWSLAKSALVLGAALIPFGPFLIDRRLREEQALAGPDGGHREPGQPH